MLRATTRKMAPKTRHAPELPDAPGQAQTLRSERGIRKSCTARMNPDDRGGSRSVIREEPVGQFRREDCLVREI